MNEFLEQFIAEARELVEAATADLLVLEARPDDRERVDGAFRALHTLKGAAGIVEFPPMERLMHACEDALGAVRSGARQATPTLVGDCLAALDLVVQWTEQAEASGELPSEAQGGADLTARLAINAASAAPEVQDDWLQRLALRRPVEFGKAAFAVRYAPDRQAFFTGEDPLLAMSKLPGLLTLDALPKERWPPLLALDPYACALTFEALVEARPESQVGAGRVEIVPLSASAADHLPPAAALLLEAQANLLREPGEDGRPGRHASAVRAAANVLRSLGQQDQADWLQATSVEVLADGRPETMVEALHAILSGRQVERRTAGSEVTPGREAEARTIRIDVERIDKLVNLTAELTAAKNAVGHLAGLAQRELGRHAVSIGIMDQHAHLDRLTRELQGSVLGLRVRPLRSVFQRFPRVVREIASTLGKAARLITEGDETEADKAVVESLFEPLLHIVRNAIGHGLEPPDVRAARGKPATGTITLRAFREGEHVIVEVADDGGGVDLARVRETAIRRGLVTENQLDTMSDQAVESLIFQPGFSTAATATGLSGRGVGMDAVRAAVERLGGVVQVHSRPGVGATFRLTLPFSVMVTEVMTLEAGGQLFGVPLDQMVETLRIPQGYIARIGAAEAVLLRGRTVALVDLRKILAPDATDGADETLAAVVAVDGEQVALRIDRLGMRLDVMLKPPEGLLSSIPAVSGVAVLGDGRVLLILDVRELLR